MEKTKAFEEAAILQDRAMRAGDSKEIDRYGAQMQEIAKELYLENRIDELCPLLHHTDEVIRGNAAMELLPFFTIEAEKVLEELAANRDKGRGKAIYTNSYYTLREWRKGNIKYDYDNK